MRRFLSFLAGALTGAFVGAALVILLTPVPGTEIQNQLRQRAQAVQSEMKTAADARRTELEKRLAELRAPRKTEE